MNRVYITGIGIISSIGSNITQTLHSLTTNKHGIGPIKLLDTIHKNDFVAGEVPESNKKLIENLGLNERDKNKYTRTALLAMTAAKEAYINAAINEENGVQTGVLSANTVGGMSLTELHYPATFMDKDIRFSLIHSPGNSTEEIARLLNIRDYVTTISTACSSSANSIMNAARMIKHGRLDRAIAGGADALSKFTINGFRSLMILDPEQCKPFDENRKGLNIGEGAAYLVLESESLVKLHNRQVIAELKGYANANDAFHQTASSPNGKGALIAMSKALQQGDLIPDDISYINVHGTGTTNNDLTEGTAMSQLFNRVPPFSSTKAFTGHTLGAAGAVEAVFSVLSLQNDIIFPNLNLHTSMKEFDFTPETKISKNAGIRHVLSNSFGFGGNNTTLIFSRVEMPDRASLRDTY